MKKEIVEYKESFSSKIINFFKNLFNKKEKDELEKSNVEQKNTENPNFKENIIVKQDEKEFKILALQKDYKAGLIKEEDMSDEEHQALIELYQEQNEKLKNEINIRKDRIKKKLDELKAS